MAFNKHGLNRHIPDPVKLAVRRDCGFGCVFCGSTVVEYEHFSPDFVDATEHNADGIALVCPTHHSMVTKGQIPKEQVAEARLNPKPKQTGFASERHPYFRGVPELLLGGGLRLIDVPVPIMVSGQPIISFQDHHDANAITTISMALSDQKGSSILHVVENEWQIDSGLWDFQSIANRYIIQSSGRECYLQLKFNPPNLIEIYDAFFFVGGIPLRIDESGLYFEGTTLSNCTFESCSVGFGFN